jgi:hypothetical protein
MLLEDAAPGRSHFNNLGVGIAEQAPNTSTHAWATRSVDGEMGMAWSKGGS